MVLREAGSAALYGLIAVLAVLPSLVALVAIAVPSLRGLDRAPDRA